LSWLSWGRLRPDHTQGILFGWVGNAFLAYLYHAVPRLSGRPVTSRRLGWLLFVARDVPLRYVWTSIIFYLVVSLQGSWQSLMPVNRLVHFTDWVIGHSHLAMIGFGSFAAIGGLLHVWKRTPGVRYNERAANWSFWLVHVGLLLMVSDLTIAGLIQGALWQSEAAWMDSVRASMPYWIFRSVAALPLLAGFAALGLAMLTGPLGQTVSTEAAETEQDAENVGPTSRAPKGAASPGSRMPTS
jgi:cbb3-type cytochrome oxidase subunit 1